MRIKNIVVEDFCNYKLPSMFIVSSKCDWKCCREGGYDKNLCQNSSIASLPSQDIDDEYIYNQFVENDITKAIVIGGLEPILQIDEVLHLISVFREHDDNHDFVIYTGYYPNEVQEELDKLCYYDNIVVKFGRYIPNKPSCFDRVLGVSLASNNQFAIRIS